MALFDFVKDAGKNLVDNVQQATLNEEDLTKELTLHGLEIDNLKLAVNEGKVIVSGKSSTQELKEKTILCLGNIKGVAQIDDRITVDESLPQSGFYTVKRGDTLSGIAKEQYGDASKYPKIFEANKPMLKDANKIYPGQVLRIPKV